MDERDFSHLLSRKCKRKEVRKAGKKLKKISKIAHSSHKKLEDVIREKLAPSKKKKKKKKPKSKKSMMPLSVPADDLNTEKRDFQAEAKRTRLKLLHEQLKEDDREIKKLEKNLGYKRRKNQTGLPKIYISEGLDYLLDLCDETKRREIAEREKDEELFPKDDFDEPLTDSEQLFTDDEEDEAGVTFGTDEEEDEDSEKDAAQVDVEEEEESEADEIVEDIYGRKVHKKTREVVTETTAAGAKAKLEELNQSSTAVAEKKLALEKAIRSITNKLNEATLAMSIKSLESIYASNSRNDVKQVYFELIFKAVFTPFALPDRLLLEYASFVTLTHQLVSSEITAHFVESLVMRILESNDAEENPLRNAMTLLSHVYNLRVVKSQLLVDMLVHFRENFEIEKAISLILHVITYAGSSLKKRDGPLLVGFISATQGHYEKLAAADETSNRLKFLCQELMSLKNGHIMVLTSRFDSSLLDHFVKVVRALSKGATNKEGELAFGLDDILHVNERGRWWIVGSAWQPSAMEEARPSNKVAADGSEQSRFEPHILALAAKAKMNTTVRRNVFCTMMSANDDAHAFERLLKLGLKGHQEREIIHICVITSTIEAKYNPFYASLLDRFSTYNKRFQLTTQYAVWDRVRDLANLKNRQRLNLAYLIAALIQNQTLGLSVLKVINFGSINPLESALLKRVLYRLLTQCSEYLLVEIFSKVTQRHDELFSQGLQLFVELSLQSDDFADLPDAELFEKRLSVVKNMWGMS
ncbi:nucleolar MIF4G domain-containing protein 1 [Aphelenchoides avenae]|nr:nucleolar MIF4G domain-containing protein 1 [Aphelenchus avenae]